VTNLEFREAIQAIGVNIDQSGRMLGFSRRHAHRFATGESKVPTVVERFLTLMTRFEIGYSYDVRSRKREFTRRYQALTTSRPSPSLRRSATALRSRSTDMGM
jgi:hypothetical protein